MSELIKLGLAWTGVVLAGFLGVYVGVWLLRLAAAHVRARRLRARGTAAWVQVSVLDIRVRTPRLATVAEAKTVRIVRTSVTYDERHRTRMLDALAARPMREEGTRRDLVDPRPWQGREDEGVGPR